MKYYNTTVTKRGYISATVIAYSKHSSTGTELITYELEYPRFIHAEFMTHRMLSKNSASSRAIPVKTMHEHIVNTPQAPIHWGKNQPGMQAKEELQGLQLESAKQVWDAARTTSLSHANVLSQIGLHKQAANRITEPFMQMKVVCSGTEWANFFWLRNHPDAQPEIRELAQAMHEARELATCWTIEPGEWHLPYIGREWGSSGIVYTSEGERVSLEDARIVSASCCAQVSYRKNDTSIEKARDIYARLVGSEPVHASPVEHQATPIPQYLKAEDTDKWDEYGITHMRRDGSLWSGNFQWWTQYRQLLNNHTKWKE